MPLPHRAERIRFARDRATPLTDVYSAMATALRIFATPEMIPSAGDEHRPTGAFLKSARNFSERVATHVPVPHNPRWEYLSSIPIWLAPVNPEPVLSELRVEAGGAFFDGSESHAIGSLCRLSSFRIEYLLVCADCSIRSTSEKKKFRLQQRNASMGN